MSKLTTEESCWRVACVAPHTTTNTGTTHKENRKHSKTILHEAVFDERDWNILSTGKSKNFIEFISTKMHWKYNQM